MSRRIEWLKRQAKDQFVLERNKRKLRSRSAFKLEEIDNKHKFLRPGQRVIDIGAAPGGWTQVAVSRTHSDKQFHSQPAVIMNDLLPVEFVSGSKFVQGDFSDRETREGILELLEGGEADVVLCDIAPNNTGDKETDHFRQINLAYLALDFALQVLSPESTSTFLCKVYQGSDEPQFVNEVKANFTSFKRLKPKASRKESKEFYVLGRGLKA
eukprot:CAMPEP_0204856296 /NCGR_PEP_ID=MMETSP1347-20130617/18130_1 /ASSEMBLY_ACC=CAM_ASM_000690 /TAXON_ID=215587 /ORGANISM="Aplanochytrium stocchinoi, Strain GSBS06" /LENGTH=211 /DNA_ID=CAMNT_0052002889 /DNA_START=56 /DNA_END=694 /DNA_ORIENTATION=+